MLQIFEKQKIFRMRVDISFPGGIDGGVLQSAVVNTVTLTTTDNEYYENKRARIQLVYGDDSLSAVQNGLSGLDYENGVLIHDGTALFKVRVTCLSSQHNGKHFKFKVLIDDHPDTYLTSVFRTVSKKVKVRYYRTIIVWGSFLIKSLT